jgi:hypothetical protein
MTRKLHEILSSRQGHPLKFERMSQSGIQAENSAIIKDNQLRYDVAMPVAIEPEAEYERLLAIIEPMMSRELTPEEERLFDLLTPGRRVESGFCRRRSGQTPFGQ